MMTLEEETIATTAVLAALAGRTCALCILHRQAEDSLMRSFFREMVMDGESQEKLAKHGLCPHHFYLVLAAPDKLGAALALKTLVRAAMKTDEADRPDRCFMCGDLRNAASRHAQVVIELYALGGEGRKLLESGPGFCLPHLEFISRMALPGRLARARAGFVDLCFRMRTRNLKQLEEEISWFIRKFDYRMAGEPWHGVEDIIQRVTEKLAGAPGLPWVTRSVLNK